MCIPLEFFVWLTYLCIAGVGFCFFMLFRNNWVYKHRTKLLEYEDTDDLGRILERYNEYESYDTMYWKFWKWDIETFRRKK